MGAVYNLDKGIVEISHGDTSAKLCAERSHVCEGGIIMETNETVYEMISGGGEIKTVQCIAVEMTLFPTGVFSTRESSKKITMPRLMILMEGIIAVF